MIRRRSADLSAAFVLSAGLLALAPALHAVAAPAAPHPVRVAAGSGPVVLAQQPDSPLDRTARALNSDDIEGAEKRGETPVLLIGSAQVSIHHREDALFVQVQSASLCGSAGCSTSVYLHKGAEWTKVLDSVSGPIRISQTIHGGMHDLIVGDKDRWTWSGSAYRDTLSAPPIGNLRRSVERHQETVRENAKAAAAAPQ